MKKYSEISIYAIPGLTLDLNAILKKTASVFGVTVEQMQSRTQKHEIAFARHAYSYFARKLTGKPLATIGYQTVKHHATVMSSIKRAANLSATKDKEFYPKFRELENYFEIN